MFGSSKSFSYLCGGFFPLTLKFYTIMDKKLQICATIKDGFSLGFSNFLSVIAITLLYLLTIWIPYLNVGTTIAFCALPAEIAKGKVVNPFYIFEAKYRRNMGEFFILYALMFNAVIVGFCFLLIPGYVIAIAWSFALVLFVDKDLNALASLRESNRITYGNKWRIFWTFVLAGLALGLLMGIISGLLAIGHNDVLEVIAVIIDVIIVLFMIPALIGIEASIYRQLTTGKFIGVKHEPKALEAPVAPQAPKAPVAPQAPKAPEAPKAASKAPKAPKSSEQSKASKAPKADKQEKADKPAPKAAPKNKKPAPKANKAGNADKPKAAPKANKPKE